MCRPRSQQQLASIQVWDGVELQNGTVWCPAGFVAVGYYTAASAEGIAYFDVSALPRQDLLNLALPATRRRCVLEAIRGLCHHFLLLLPIMLCVTQSSRLGFPEHSNMWLLRWHAAGTSFCSPSLSPCRGSVPSTHHGLRLPSILC